MSSVRVEAYRSLDAAGHLAEAVAALNLASRRPAPYFTFSYMTTFLAHDEFAEPGTQPLLLAAFRGDELVGFLALRRRPLRLYGLPSVKIEFLVTHDVERPTLVARPEDEAVCSEAFWRHLVERERGWSFVELMEQEAQSPLLPPDWVAGHGFWVRRYENNPNSTIRLDHEDVASYFKTLGSNHRRGVRVHSNRLLDAGEAEVVLSRDPRALVPLLELYVDIENRSWKKGTRAAVARHPERLAFFRALSKPGQVPALWYVFFLLDGLPIAAHLNGSFGKTVYLLEMVFDEDYRDLSPGKLMNLITVGETLATGGRELNLLGNFAKQKERWEAVITDTSSIQVFRWHSLFSIKAHLGDLTRKVKPAAPSQRETIHNLSKPQRESEEAPVAARPPREPERRRCAESLAALEREGATLTRLRGPDLAARLPFPRK